VLGVAGSCGATPNNSPRIRPEANQAPATLAGVAGLMAAIGVLACWIPARRASRIDPVITMRAL
jgi:hypothetical protein